MRRAFPITSVPIAPSVTPFVCPEPSSSMSARTFTGGTSAAGLATTRTSGQSSTHSTPSGRQPGSRREWFVAQPGFLSMAIRATRSITLITESDRTIMLEGNRYFPPANIRTEYLVPSATHELRMERPGKLFQLHYLSERCFLPSTRGAS